MSAPAGVLLRLVVLISGRGSNLMAIAAQCANGQLNARTVQVIADQPDAAGLGWAASQGIPAQAIAATQFRADGVFDRAAFEQALASVIDAGQPDLIILAGFMRVLSAGFVARYAGRLLNIHPSLLPAYKGLHTHERVLAAGELQHGASVHFVTAELDGGPVVLQASVPVLPGDDVTTLAARVQAQEHLIYPQVVHWIAEQRLQWLQGLVVMDGQPLLMPLQWTSEST
jgi:phosphoribosylglycinamide formyltransferase-1